MSVVCICVVSLCRLDRASGVDSGEWEKTINELKTKVHMCMCVGVCACGSVYVCVHMHLNTSTYLQMCVREGEESPDRCTVYMQLVNVATVSKTRTFDDFCMCVYVWC